MTSKKRDFVNSFIQQRGFPKIAEDLVELLDCYEQALVDLLGTMIAKRDKVAP